MSGKEKGQASQRWHHDALPTPVEVMEQVFINDDWSPADVALLLEKCMEAKIRRDQAEEYYKEQLAEIQQAEGLDGLRHNQIVFRMRQVKGRKTLDKEKLVMGMEMQGLSKAAIKSVIEYATKTGDEYYVKEIGVI